MKNQKTKNKNYLSIKIDNSDLLLRNVEKQTFLLIKILAELKRQKRRKK